MKSPDTAAPCPCGRVHNHGPLRGKTLAYGACCGQYLEGNWLAGPFPPDAQALMRSRYTAFVLERADYLLATWDASFRPERIDFDAGTKWLGLEVRSVCCRDETHAEVEFVARQKPSHGPAQRLHERSRFIRSGQRWQYLDGDLL
jgi:SEC-C motif domain protein